MPPPTEPIPTRIFTIRGHRVVLDADLARLYGVPTHVFNQAVKRNRHRFPEDFAFQLTRDEVARLKSQFATLSRDTNSSQIVMSSSAAAAAERAALDSRLLATRPRPPISSRSFGGFA